MKNILNIPYGNLENKVIRLDSKSPEEIVQYLICIKDRLDEKDSIISVSASSNQKELEIIENKIIDNFTFNSSVSGGILNSRAGITYIIKTKLGEVRTVNCGIDIYTNPVDFGKCNTVLMGQSGRAGTVKVVQDIILDPNINGIEVTNIGTDTDAILQFKISTKLIGDNNINTNNIPKFKIGKIETVDYGNNADASLTQSPDNPDIWNLNLVLVTGKPGIDGKDGINGKDGKDGKDGNNLDISSLKFNKDSTITLNYLNGDSKNIDSNIYINNEGNIFVAEDIFDIPDDFTINGSLFIASDSYVNGEKPLPSGLFLNGNIVLTDGSTHYKNTWNNNGILCSVLN